MGKHTFPKGTPWRGRVEEQPDGCLIWRGRLNRQGYGVLGSRRNPSGSVLAHRIVYTIERGEIPAGHVLDHLCRNPACVNPDHLEPVTQAENLLRSPLSPARKTHCIRGHKFTPENIYTPPGTEWRQCIACQRVRERERAARRRSNEEVAS